MKQLLYILLLLTILPRVAFCENLAGHQNSENVNGIMSLSEGVRELLSREMLALEQGMMSIIPAYVSGDWRAISATAGKMKNSYIFKQSLTKDQKEELHSQLPHGFIEQDKQFHYLAGMLEHVAERKKPELINFYFSEMTEACVGCHSVYATHRFPALSQDISTGRAH